MKRTAGTMLVLAGFCGCVALPRNPGLAGRKGLQPPSGTTAVGPRAHTTPFPPIPGVGGGEARDGAGQLTALPKGPGRASAPSPLPASRVRPTGRPHLLALASARPNPPPVATTAAAGLSQQHAGIPGVNKPVPPPSPVAGPISLPPAFVKANPPGPGVLAGEAAGLGEQPVLPPSHDFGTPPMVSSQDAVHRDEEAGTDKESPSPYAEVMPPPGGPKPPDASEAGIQPRGTPMMRVINTKRITLHFEVEDVGPSGVSAVELWYTKNGKEWHKYQAPPKAHAYVIEVEEEGLYGFTLLARNGLGVGAEPPQSGDLPQVWVKIDLTQPTVNIDKVEPNLGGRVNLLAVEWTARDENLGRQPIRLSYAADETGPWLPIASRLPNTGKFEWTVPPKVPPKLFVRVEATDLAGNHNSTQTPEAVILDTKKPRVSILDVSPNH